MALKTSVEILDGSGACPRNWAMGIFTVDNGVQKEYYGGLLINEWPDSDDPPMGQWFTSKRKAEEHVKAMIERLSNEPRQRLDQERIPGGPPEMPSP